MKRLRNGGQGQGRCGFADDGYWFPLAVWEDRPVGNAWQYKKILAARLLKAPILKHYLGITHLNPINSFRVVGVVPKKRCPVLK